MIAAKEYAKDNAGSKFYAVTGIRNEKDFIDLRRITTFTNTPNVTGLALSNPGFMQRASELRDLAVKGKFEKLREYFPNELKPEEFQTIIKMLKDNILSEQMQNTVDSFVSEWLEGVNENSSGTAIAPQSVMRSQDRAEQAEAQKYTPYIGSLLEYMLDQKMRSN